MWSAPIVTKFGHIPESLEFKLIIKTDNVTELFEEIYLIENFISDEEIQQCIDLINSTPESGWGQDYIDQLKSEALGKFGTEDYMQMVDEGKMNMNTDWLDKSIAIPGELPIQLSDKIKNLFKEDVFMLPMQTIQRHYPGSFMREHVDQDHDPSLVYACVIYLNGNFNGGELYFPEIDLEIKPKRGSMMLFSASKKYLHGVRKVLDGPTRYTITGFIWKAPV